MTNAIQTAKTLRETRRRLLASYNDSNLDVRRAGDERLRHFYGGRRNGLRTALNLIDTMLAETAHAYADSQPNNVVGAVPA